MKKLLSGLMAVLFTTGIAFAQPPEPPADMEGMEPPQMGLDGDMPQPPKMSKQDMKKMKKSFEEIAKELNLNDEQKQQIETMAKADKEKKKEIRKQIKEKFKAVDEELLKENYDINTINGLTAEIQSLQGEMAKMNIDGKIQMRSILTYDQFKQIEEMKQKNKNKSINKTQDKQTKKDEVSVSSDTAKAKADKNVKAAKPAKTSDKSSKNTKNSKDSKPTTNSKSNKK